MEKIILIILEPIAPIAPIKPPKIIITPLLISYQ